MNTNSPYREPASYEAPLRQLSPEDEMRLLLRPRMSAQVFVGIYFALHILLPAIGRPIWLVVALPLLGVLIWRLTAHARHRRRLLREGYDLSTLGAEHPARSHERELPSATKH